MNINLVDDTINKNDIDSLITWLQTYPRLTKGPLTEQFEKEWSEWLGVKHSVYVNSGSSANLLMAAVLLHGDPRTRQVIVPAVSWATTIAPFKQLGFIPILCDCDPDTLALDVDHLQSIIDDPEYAPSAVVVVHALGFTAKMNEIQEICDANDLILLEDSCETVGSTYNNKKTGTFGVMSTFSFYFGHHMSTIEGGMICTDNDDIYALLKMLRSHGWDRDLDDERKESLRKKHNISEFKSLYTFYIEGYNLRATDLQAYIGLEQLKRLDEICDIRESNYKYYQENIHNPYWKPNPSDGKISNFAYPIIHPKRDEIIKALTENNIECRPLICGSMQKQPFLQRGNYYIKKVGESFANDIVEEFGMYIPNHQNMTEDHLDIIITIINDITKE